MLSRHFAVDEEEKPKTVEKQKVEPLKPEKPKKVNLAKSVVPGQRPGLLEPTPAQLEVIEEERPRV